MKNVLAGGKKNVVHLCTTTSCSGHCYFIAGLVCSRYCLEHLVALQSRGKKKIFRDVSPKCTFLPWGRSYRLLNPPIETSVFVVLNGEMRMARESGGLRRRLPAAAAPSAGRFPRCPPAPEVTAGVNGAAQQRGSLRFYVDTFLTVPFKRA